MPGYIQQRGPNSYRLVVSGGYDNNGKLIQYRKTVRAASRREAEKLLALYVAEITNGLGGNGQNITLAEFIDVWFARYAEPNLAPKTIWRYRQLSERIKTALGGIRLQKLRPLHLQAFYANLAEPGIRKNAPKRGPLSGQTILHYHRLLHAILHKAVMWQYITANPAGRVDPPKTQKHEIAAYDAAAVSALVAALRQDTVRNQALVLMTLATGARLGEVLGLTWDRINLDTGEIDIAKAYQYVPGRGRFEKPPKNKRSIRKVALPTEIVALLRAWRAEQSAQRIFMGTAWRDDTNAVFTSYLGTRLLPGTVSHWFTDFIRRHKLPHITFHGLRHTAASLLISYGASVVDVSRVLGHSVPSTTLNIYSHAIQRADRVLANKIGGILKNAQK